MDDPSRSGPGRGEEAQAFFRRLGRHLLSSSPWDDREGQGETGSRRPPDLPAGSPVGRYRIVERIGAGGMGTVYRAHDAALDRDVALKLLPPALAADPESRERFLREARAAASLDHPNVVTVHEVGEGADSLPFLAMALYRGETLKERLARGPLPVEQALAVAAGIARGLAAAHARGIVHRDVKPGNVFLPEDGGVKLLDFGLAKVADHTVTRPGVTPGTVAYMSPEQLEGGPADHRSDLWALGVVLYEMLSGMRPFRGEKDRVVLHAIRHEEPEDVRTLRPEAPEGVARTVEGLLRKRPEERFQGAEAVVEALEGEALGSSAPRPVARARSPLLRRPRLLRWGVAAAALLLVLGASVRWAGPGGSPAAPGEDPGEPRSILVADFQGFTPDPLLGDALSQALRADLARLPGLRVAGAAAMAGGLSRMRREPGTPLHSPLARELAIREGIPIVLDGEVRRAGAGYVISATLLEAATGEVLHGWREAAPDPQGILDALDRLSQAVRAELGESGESLGSAARGEEFFPGTTPSLEALRAYSHGNRSYFAGDLAHAAALYQETIRLDPAFALAHFMLALTLPKAGLGRDRWGYARAYELRDGLPPNERFAVEGWYHVAITGNLSAAIHAFRNQVEAAKPTGDVVMYGSLGGALITAGDLPGAEAALREAREVYPHAQNQARLVEVLHHQGRVDEAAVALEDAEALFPGNPVLLRARAQMAAASGDLARADSLAGELPWALGIGQGRRLRAQIAAVEGRLQDALAHLAAVQEEFVRAGDASEAAEVAVAAARLRLVQGRRDAAVAGVGDLLSRGTLDSLDPLDRPYLPLVRFFAEAGEPDRAREILAAYEAEVPEAFHGADRREFLRARAALRVAEGDGGGAVADLEEASRVPPPHLLPESERLIPIQERPEMARAYEAVGRPADAVAALERYLALPTLGRIGLDAFELPAALFRLGELHEALGDPRAAAGYYLWFAELWRSADPELQPKVEEARRRAASVLSLG
jgi:eukaryotic-like serine/threonine-protein kinase